MKKSVALFFCLFLLFGCCVAGCATSRLPSDATADQIIAANKLDCDNARLAVETADAMLAALPPGTAKEIEEYTAYWRLFKVGAQFVLTNKCGVALPPGK